MYSPSSEEAEEVLEMALEFLEKAEEMVRKWKRTNGL